MLKHLSIVRRPVAVGAALLVALAAASIIPWQVRSQQSLHLAGPVRLDSTTPAQQHGFALLLIQPGPGGEYSFRTSRAGWSRIGATVGWEKDGAAACLAIRPPRWPDASDLSASIHPTIQPAFFTAAGRSSHGTTFPLAWNIQSVPEARLLIVAIPAVLRNINPYVDVNISDRWGHTAHWRILGLPGIQRLIPLPAAPVARQSAAGMTLTARAWRARDSYGAQSNVVLWGEVKVNGSPAGGGDWMLTNNHPMTPEWGFSNPYFPHAQSGGSPLRPGMDASVPFRSNDFAELSHFAGMQVTLRKFEKVIEKLTFHNLDAHSENGMSYVEVKRRQSLTTPSGITVTLPAQSPLTGGRIINNNGVRFSLLRIALSPAHFPPDSPEARFSPFMMESLATLQSDSLPRSSLFQRYHKPLTIQVSSPQLPGASMSGSLGSSAFILDSTLRNAPPAQLRDLTVILTEQVEVRSIPLTFTVPVSDTIPADLLRYFTRRRASAGIATTGTVTAGGGSSTIGTISTTGTTGGAVRTATTTAGGATIGTSGGSMEGTIGGSAGFATTTSTGGTTTTGGGSTVTTTAGGGPTVPATTVTSTSGTGG